MTDLYKRRLGTWQTAHIPQPRGFTVNGMMTHAMTRSGYGHAESPEWVYSQSFEALGYEHRIYHENGGKHRK